MDVVPPPMCRFLVLHLLSEARTPRGSVLLWLHLSLLRPKPLSHRPCCAALTPPSSPFTLATTPRAVSGETGS